MISAIWRGQKVLVLTGALSLFAFAVFVVLSLIDPVQILGINRWIKPIKFAISIAVYLWTLAAYLHFINGRERAKRVIGIGASLLMIGELALITMQSARGTTSHFNITTPFDNAVFSAMGIMIVFNTFLIVYLLYLYFKAEISLPPAVIWGMRWGIILFIFAAFIGGYMSVAMKHSVGIADGGPGLPLVNWSTRGGDLRIAHFFGLHALQIVPMFGIAMRGLEPATGVKLTRLFGAIYFVVFAFVYWQALGGRPLVVLP